jgi:hypothetical protein
VTGFAGRGQGWMPAPRGTDRSGVRENGGSLGLWTDPGLLL